MGGEGKTGEEETEGRGWGRPGQGPSSRGDARRGSRGSRGSARRYRGGRRRGGEDPAHPRPEERCAARGQRRSSQERRACALRVSFMGALERCTSWNPRPRGISAPERPQLPLAPPRAAAGDKAAVLGAGRGRPARPRRGTSALSLPGRGEGDACLRSGEEGGPQTAGAGQLREGGWSV